MFAFHCRKTFSLRTLCTLRCCLGKQSLGPLLLRFLRPIALFVGLESKALLLARAIRCCARPHGPFLFPLVAASAMKFVTIVFVFDVLVVDENFLLSLCSGKFLRRAIPNANDDRRDVAKTNRALLTKQINLVQKVLWYSMLQ